MLDYGTQIAYPGAENPQKQATAQYTFTFAGWNTEPNKESGSMDLGTVVGNEDYYAAYSKTTNTYTITWKSQDGTSDLLVQENQAYGTAIAYPGATPTKAGDAHYTYTFAGWNTEPNKESGTTDLGSVTGNATYYAAFSKTVNKYTITWKSQDGSAALETDAAVEYGTAPSFDGDAPTKEQTAQYTYTFAGWATSANQETGTPASSLPTVTGNATYYAAFSKETNKYTVTWMKQDGSAALETDAAVEYGTAPSFDGATPTKAETAEFTYTFAGWATSANQETGTPVGNLPTVSGTTNYYAAFSKTVRTYTVSFGVNDAEFGSVAPASIANVPYNSTITVSDNKVTINGTTVTATPSGDVIEGNVPKYRYLFDNWSVQTGSKVTGAMTVTATFDKVDMYKITWQISDTEKYEEYWGNTQTPEYTGETPTKDPTSEYTYRFSGWLPEIGPVDGGPVTYVAQFTEIPFMTVIFDPNGGEVSETSRKVPQGDAIGTMPIPSYGGYRFTGWYYSASGGERVDATTIINSNETLYAHWQAPYSPDDDDPSEDPSVPVEEKTEYPDGSVETKTEYLVRNEDGTYTTVTETVFEDKDGNKTVTSTEKTTSMTSEGTSTLTETKEVDPDGTVIETETEKVVTVYGSQTSTMEKTTSPTGEVTVTETSQSRERSRDGSLETTESVKTTNPNGSSEESVTYTYDGADGSSVSSQKDVTTQRDGSSTTIIDRQTETSDDTVIGEQTKMSANADGSLRSVESTITVTPRIGDPSTITISGDGKRIDAKLQSTDDEQVSIALEALEDMDSDKVILGIESTDGALAMSSDSIAQIAAYGYGISVGSEKQSVALDADTVKGLAEEGGDVQLIVVVAEPEVLTPEQETVIGDSYAVQVTLLVNGQEVHELDGKAEIQIEPGYKAAYVYYVGDDGTTEEIACSYDTTTGVIQFDVPHFSVYMVTAEAYEPAKTGGDDNTVWIIAIIAIILLVLIAAIILYRRKGASA